jgi:ribonuclease P/MRP protein subunit RPP1
MYEAVHARPDGESTVARFARTAAECGYDGVVVRNHGDARPEYDPAAIREAYAVDVVEGVEIRADDPTQASGYVGNFRPDYTVLGFHGGTPELNRFAVEQERVDVLCHPMRGDGDLNHVLVRAARENGVRIEVNLADVLRTSGGRRVQVLQDLRKLRELVETYDVPYVVSADPFSHLHLRAPRELRALGGTIGFDADAIERGLREWGRLAERNRERQSESFIEPGVREGRYEEER